MRTWLIALIVGSFCIAAHAFTYDFQEPPANYQPSQWRYIKRGSLSNMMRIGKRSAPAAGGGSAPQSELAACDDCNLGTLMRIGRRR